jgi:hypothetical protein
VRVRPHLVVCSIGEADTLEQPVDPVECGCVAGHSRKDAHVLSARHPWVKGRILENAADAAPNLTETVGNWLVEHPCAASARTGKSEQHADRRRLACAVWPEVTEEGSLGNLEVDRLDGDAATEAFAESLCRYGCRDSVTPKR